MNKSSREIVSLAVLLVLSIAPAPALAFTQAHSSTPSNHVVIPLNYFDSLQVDSYSNATQVMFNTTSNVTISVAFMKSLQFTAFNESGGAISDALFIQNGTDVKDSLHVGRGVYYLVFYAYVSTANVSYSYDVFPNNPFQSGNLSPPQPTGVASFGLYNDSGSLASYEIRTNEVVGMANIYSILAYNATAEAFGTSLSGASLQLNSMLVVAEKGGSQHVYWCQNVPDLVTSASVISYGDNVWNFTSDKFFLSNESVTSQTNGFVSSYNNSGTTQYYYSYGTSNSTYEMPFRLALLMNESLLPNRGVLLQMGSKVLGNGSAGALPTEWFDNITIHDSLAHAAYFYTSGNDSTPTDHFFDTEFVFGGEGNGVSTSFREMNASLGLFYYNESSHALLSFPSYYNFGGDTQEGAYNLNTTYLGLGFAQVSVGKPRYSYLGIASGIFSLASGRFTVPEFPSYALVVALAAAFSGAAFLSNRRRRYDSSSEGVQINEGRTQEGRSVDLFSSMAGVGQSESKGRQERMSLKCD